jgi:hypothetical protein
MAFAACARQSAPQVAIRSDHWSRSYWILTSWSAKGGKPLSGFEPGTKILLAMVASLYHLPATSCRGHKYYIPSYLQARYVSCLQRLGCVRLPRKLGLRAAAPIVRVECGRVG